MLLLLRGWENAKLWQVSFLHLIRICVSVDLLLHYLMAISLIRRNSHLSPALATWRLAWLCAPGVGRDGLPAFIWRALTESRYICSMRRILTVRRKQYVLERCRVGRLSQALMEDCGSINGCDAKWLVMVDSYKVTLYDGSWRVFIQTQSIKSHPSQFMWTRSFCSRINNRTFVFK